VDYFLLFGFSSKSSAIDNRFRVLVRAFDSRSNSLQHIELKPQVLVSNKVGASSDKLIIFASYGIKVAVEHWIEAKPEVVGVSHGLVLVSIIILSLHNSAEIIQMKLIELTKVASGAKTEMPPNKKPTSNPKFTKALFICRDMKTY
jgi:hypothetical protein